MANRARMHFEVVVAGDVLGRVLESEDGDWAAYDAHQLPVGTYLSPTLAREAVVERSRRRVRSGRPRPQRM